LADCTHHSDALAPVLVEVHPNRLFPSTPRVALAHPHVAAGLVEVDDVLSLLYPPRQFHHKRLHLLKWHLAGTTELVLDHSVGDLVAAVELAEGQGCHVHAEVGQLLDALVQVQRCPVTQYFVAEQVVVDGALDLALAFPGLLEVRLSAVDEAQAVVHVAFEGREDGGHRQVHLAGDLLVGQEGL